MPIYEYRCANCGHTFEEIQQFSDPDPEHCPKCDAEQVARLVSRSNFQLKGGGWYADDYESAPGADSGSTAGDSANSDESGGDASGTESTTGTETSGTKSTSGGDEQAAAE